MIAKRILSLGIYMIIFLLNRINYISFYAIYIKWVGNIEVRQMYQISVFIFKVSRFVSNYLGRQFSLSRLLPFFTSRANRKKMNFFGMAVRDYNWGRREFKFIFHINCLQKRHNKGTWELNLKTFFRKESQLTLLEKQLISLAKGDILDIGSNTGYYIPSLMKRGVTTGMEISPPILKISHEAGLLNCIEGDIFKYEPCHKFDTITLLGNDIVLAGSFYNLRKMLKKFKAILNNDGQILMIIKQVRTLKYWSVVYTPEYRGEFGVPAKYLFLNAGYFITFCAKLGFEGKIIGKEGPNEDLSYLLRLEKKAEA